MKNSTKNILKRYMLIIKRLRKSPATLEEIKTFFEIESEISGDEISIQERTFNRDKETIYSLFGVNIQYNYLSKKYHIITTEDKELGERILEAFDTFNALSLSSNLTNNIYFENRKAVGTEFLFGMLHAIKNKLQIRLSHHKYWDDDITIRLVEPCALKEFKSRWYLIAKDLKDAKVKSFGLDRILDLVITKKHFNSDPDISVNALYKNCFGIITSDTEKPSLVKLCFDNFTGKYVKSFPLHETQIIIEDNPKELVITLEVYLTDDFYSEILSFGNNVTVLGPEKMINDFKNTYKSAFEKY